MYKESSNRKNNPGDLISHEPQKAPCCTQDVRAQSVFFHGSSDCSGQLAQTPWPTTRGRGLLRPDWVSLAVKSFNDLAQFFAIKNFSAARHIRVYTKHVHILQLLHELFHLLLAVRAEAACATASASSRSGSSNTRRPGVIVAASRSQSKQLGAYWGLRAGGWAGAGGQELGAGAGGWGGGLGASGAGGSGLGAGGGAGGLLGLGAGTRLRHTRDTRERFANAPRTLRERFANACERLCERLRTLRGRFANALATIPGQPLDPWTPTVKTGTLLLRIREN